MMRKVLVALAVAATMVTGTGMANAATVDSPAAATGFPARVVGRWFEAARAVGPFGLRIGPPCYGLTVWQLGVTDLDGDSFCTTAVTWRNHPIGSAWEGYVRPAGG